MHLGFALSRSSLKGGFFFGEHATLYQRTFDKQPSPSRHTIVDDAKVFFFCFGKSTARWLFQRG